MDLEARSPPPSSFKPAAGGSRNLNDRKKTKKHYTEFFTKHDAGQKPASFLFQPERGFLICDYVSVTTCKSISLLEIGGGFSSRRSCHKLQTLPRNEATSA
jgi:hypothetical protein